MADESNPEEAARLEAEAAAKAKAEADAKAAAEAEAAKTREEWDYERGMATITKLRDEVKALKGTAKERDELAAKLKEIEDAQLSEQEKLTKRLADYEAKDAERAEREQALKLRLAVHNLRDTLEIADCDLALAALDRSKVEYDQDGEPTNISDVLSALLEAKPLLKGVAARPAAGGNLNAGAGNQGGPAPSLTADELDWASKLGMTAEKYAQYKSDPVFVIDDLAQK